MNQKLKKALEFATHCHAGQVRKTGEEYIEHPKRCMHILEKLGFEDEILIACLLHDTQEDSDTNYQELLNSFGSRVANMVNSLSKNKKPKGHSINGHETDYRFLLYVNRFALGVMADPGSLFIKIADQIDNMSSFSIHSVPKHKRKILEIKDYFLPIYEAKRKTIPEQYYKKFEELLQLFHHKLTEVENELISRTNYPDKKILLLDKDGTLVNTNRDLNPDIVPIFQKACHQYDIAIISGASFRSVESNILKYLDLGKSEKRLYIFPNLGANGYRIDGKKKTLYIDTINKAEEDVINTACESAIRKYADIIGYKPWGKIIEPRKGIVAFTALGVNAPRDIKSSWDPNGFKRQQIMSHIQSHLDDKYECVIGGTTTIDITKRGIDKAYALRQLIESEGYKKEDMVYIGDALYPEGNDYPIVLSGIDYEATSGPEETKDILGRIAQSSVS